MPYAPRTTLGEYRLVAPLGSGGMGDVYRAEHLRLGRPVALKVLRGSELAARFLNEARIQAGLVHPHVATLYDYFEADGRACIAMELVEGQTLAEVLRQRGRLPFPEAVRLLRPVAEAVAFLHARGVIHRDLKTHNVKVTPEGRVKLLDFGIAKDLGRPGLTQAGAVPGTPAYLSPEQVRGLPPDARSDVWALGVLLYELVTGALPFDAPDALSLYAGITRGAYTPASALAPGVPRASDALLARCLQTDPSRRFPDARALLAALPAEASAHPGPGGGRPAGGSPPPVARPVLTLRPVPRSVRIGAVVLAVALLMAAGVAVWPDSPPEAPPALAHPLPPGAIPAQVTIGTFGPPAEVLRDGVRLGETPYPLETYIGEPVELTLRRGAVQQTVRFQTGTGSRAYSFELPAR
jgi:eukaryotic-like serine/threonine-protein kinase